MPRRMPLLSDIHLWPAFAGTFMQMNRGKDEEIKQWVAS